MFYQLTILLMYLYLFYSSNLGRKIFKYKVYGIHYLFIDMTGMIAAGNANLKCYQNKSAAPPGGSSQL